MKELKEIIRSYDEAVLEGKQTALATVVHLEGSAYRRPGARMLVTEDGRLTGAISGGCLEGDALRKAQMAMVKNKPILVTYDTTDEDDAKLGIGLGCNGIISILIEPINKKDSNNSIELLKTFLSKRQTAVLVTLFSLDKKTLQPGTCLILTQDGNIKSRILDKAFKTALIADAKEALISHTSQIKSFNVEEPLTGFIEILEPSVSLVVFGAGNDSIPLVQIASILGWKTTVADGRPNYATQERFPFADSVVVTKPDAFLKHVALDERTVVVLITHNYNYDLSILRQLLGIKVSYVGVLGPKKKLNRMFDELIEKGEKTDEKNTKNVFGPSGLDIGAETSEEIALSIISEIQAVLSNRTGTFLRQKEESIHSRSARKIIQEAG